MDRTENDVILLAEQQLARLRPAEVRLAELNAVQQLDRAAQTLFRFKEAFSRLLFVKARDLHIHAPEFKEWHRRHRVAVVGDCQNVNSKRRGGFSERLDGIISVRR